MKHYSPNGRRNHGRPLKRLLDMWGRNGSASGSTPWHMMMMMMMTRNIYPAIRPPWFHYFGPVGMTDSTSVKLEISLSPPNSNDTTFVIYPLIFHCHCGQGTKYPFCRNFRRDGEKGFFLYSVCTPTRLSGGALICNTNCFQIKCRLRLRIVTWLTLVQIVINCKLKLTH